ncbi:conjugal transfer pilus assembly protein TrbC [Novosphingobium chloroacetimidivorans]|uniref:Conjugal transfer pilus assembly protein TrbC n=1 Tax=Novosphingobium chloroacetimidivorans TaxID=1428314 RepID=A0A7W7NYJ8_9SPHN|nr:type-F conjugative transfer system pilin assembly protein TrbC [Novosphingobium chloroacetimidivorans]MBB4860539.1 conjugal transfer pilus assembly protein TrbC [Novosphingobium chloroacetimidivorans]
MVRKHLLAIGGALGLGLVSAGLAQTIEGLDLGAIQSRAVEQARDAEAFLSAVSDRGKDARDEARQTVDESLAAVKAIDPTKLPKVGEAGAIDLDEMVSGAQGSLDNPRSAPLFIAFASLSMPEDSLKQMIADVHKAGGVVVFRGLPGNNGRMFAAAMRRVVSQDASGNVAIDPRLFRAFDIKAVPTYVAVSTGFTPCDDFACKSRVPPFDRVTGNVTVQYALESLAQAKGPGAPVAGAALANLVRHD